MITTETTSRYVDCKQLADYLGVSEITVRRWERGGTIPRGQRIGPRLIRWDLSAVENHLQRGTIEPHQYNPLANCEQR